MPAPKDRQSFEQLLRRHVGGGDLGSPGDCPSESVLASWFEGTLSREERSTWESHFGSCRRCQASLTLMARGGEPDAPQGSVWRKLLVRPRVLAPIAVGATAVLALSIGLRSFPDPEDVAVRAKPQTREERFLQERLGSLADRSRESDAPGMKPEAAEQKEEAPALAKSAPAGEAADTAEPGAAAGRPEAVPDESPAETILSDLGPATAKSRDDRAEASGATTIQAAGETRESLRHEETTSDRKAAETALAADRLAERRAPAAAPDELERSARTSARSATADLGADTAGDRAKREPPATKPRGSFRILAPASDTTWRVHTRGVIERTTDGGETWSIQASDPGMRPIAGAAVSDRVAWVVGQGGLVLRTTDGRTWERIPSPSGEAIVRVVPRSAAAAVVSTARGDRYETIDGGLTWSAP